MSDRRRDIQARLTEIFRDVFDDGDIELTDAMTAEDIDEWDSLMHITLIVATEKEFGMRVNAAEVSGLGDVGALISLVLERTAD